MSLRKMADQLASLIVEKQYEQAFELLSQTAKDEWPVIAIKEEYEAMVEYFEESEAQVVKGFDDEYAETQIDDMTMLYVPIQNEEGESEAIVVMFDESKNIIGLEFGRP